MKHNRYQLEAGKNIAKHKVGFSSFATWDCEGNIFKVFFHNEVLQLDAKAGDHIVVSTGVGDVKPTLAKWVSPRNPIEAAFWRSDFFAAQRVHEEKEFDAKIAANDKVKDKMPIISFTGVKPNGSVIGIAVRKRMYSDTFAPYCWLASGDVTQEDINDAFNQVADGIDQYLAGTLQEQIEHLAEEGVGSAAPKRAGSPKKTT